MAKKPTKKQPLSSVCQNKKAGFRYEILEKIECGMVLLGTEIKSLRDQGASLDESYAQIRGDELWLVDCHIPAYKFGHTTNHEPRRRRKLLLHKQQMRKLKPRVEQRGQTLVPIRIYFNERGIAKITIALASGKKHADKRQDARKKQHQRDMERALRGR